MHLLTRAVFVRLLHDYFIFTVVMFVSVQKLRKHNFVLILPHILVACLLRSANHGKGLFIFVSKHAFILQILKTTAFFKGKIGFMH